MANDNETVEQVCDWLKERDLPFAASIAEVKYANPSYDAEACLINALKNLADRILAAHKREIAAKDAEIKTLRKLVYGLLEAATVDCATCCYDYCGPNRLNCIIHEAAMYIGGIEVEK